MALVSLLESVRPQSLQEGLVYLVILYSIFTVGKVLSASASKW